MLEQHEITRLLNAAEPDFRQMLTAALMTGAMENFERYGVRTSTPNMDRSASIGKTRKNTPTATDHRGATLLRGHCRWPSR